MRISEISIQRPVLATVMSLVILLLGIVGYLALTVREYPNIDEPTVSVTTTFSGANAEIMESQVTKPLEDSLAGIDGIKFINSTSREGVSIINISFLLTRDPDAVAADVRDRVSRVRGQLPDEVNEPIVAKVEADSTPIIYLVLESETLTGGQLTDYATNLIKDRVQMISGVADTTILGARTYAMRIWLDPVKLAAYHLTANDIATVLRTQNVDLPSGRIQGAAREFTVRSNTDVNTLEQFRHLVVATQNGAQVHLEDVARVNVGVADNRTTFRYNGKPTIAVGIVKQATANPLDISREVKKAVPELQAELPPGVSLEIGNDTTVFISASIRNVYETLGEAILLVVLVITFFLRSLRAAIIPIVTIPVSLVGTFFLMDMMGFSLNTLSLLALVLAIGLVVDDAIVVLENIFRHIEHGMKPRAAAIKGANEIGFAVVAMTLTLAAVYVPVAFMGGRTGKLFTEFALTLAAAVIISGFAALTLSPMMCSLLLNAKVGSGKYAQRIERIIHRVETGYQRRLRWTLSNRWLVWPVMGVLILCIGLVFSQLKTELSPIEDRALVFIPLVGPEGATVDYMNAYAAKLEGTLRDGIPGLRSYGFVTGLGSGRLPVGNQGFGFVRLVDWAERDVNSAAIAQMLLPRFLGIPGFLAFPVTPGSLGAGGQSKPVEFIIRDSRPYPQIGADLDKLLAKLNANPGLTSIDTNLKINTPQLNVTLDRAKLADLGISPADAGTALELLMAGEQVTRFKYDGEQYDVMMQVDDALRANSTDLSQIQLRSATGALVPLATFATISATVAPRDLNRYDRLRSVTVTANTTSGYSMGEALAFTEQAARSVFPSTTRYEYGGQSREFKESSSSLALTFGLALLFIFLVLAAQFESFIDPAIILMTVPLTMLGALTALWLTGNTLNIYSEIGLITLIGLITKHGILLVEFANAAMEEGKSRLEAIQEGASLRLRPILMTTGAMVLGAIPLAVGVGAGAESRHQLGLVIVGGMTVGTLLTLFVLPPLYTYVHREKPKEAE